MKTHITYLVVIISLVVLSVFLFRGGCRQSVSNSSEYKALIDSVAKLSDAQRIKADSLRIIDQKYRIDSERSSAIIQSLTVEKDQLSDITKKLKSSVTDITGLYREARAEADTATALLLADNQANICDTYVWQSQRELYTADSIIRVQGKEIADKSAFIQKQIQFRNEFMAIANNKDNAHKQAIFMLKTENRKLNNWWHKWGKPVAFSVGGVLAGYAVGTIVK